MKQSTRCLNWLQFLISRCISIWFFGDLRGRFTQSHMVHPNPSKLICLSRLTVQKLGFQTEALPLQSSASKQGTKAKKAPGIIELHQKETKPKKMIRSWGGQLDMSGTIAFKRWHHLTSGAGSVGATPLNLTQCSASKRLSHRKLAIVSHGLSEQSRHWGLCQSSWHGTKP